MGLHKKSSLAWQARQIKQYAPSFLCPPSQATQAIWKHLIPSSLSQCFTDYKVSSNNDRFRLKVFLFLILRSITLWWHILIPLQNVSYTFSQVAKMESDIKKTISKKMLHTNVVGGCFYSFFLFNAPEDFSGGDSKCYIWRYRQSVESSTRFSCSEFLWFGFLNLFTNLNENNKEVKTFL